MVVCVEAGLGLDAAMRRVTSELATSCPVLCEEFAIANFQLQMGRPRKDVLRDLGLRTGVDDMRSLAAVIIQAEKFGSSIGAALRVQSDAMRLRRRQYAEERAAKTAVKIMIPLILFIFPGVFVVLVGPAGIQIANTLMGSRKAQAMRNLAGSQGRHAKCDARSTAGARWPLVFLVLVFLVGLGPAALEGAASCLSNWKECLGVSCRRAGRPLLDNVQDNLDDSTKTLLGRSLPISASMPWDPKMVLPAAAVVMVVAMLMLRRLTSWRLDAISTRHSQRDGLTAVASGTS